MTGIEPAAIELLHKFHWPGNVRQLRNEIDRAVALARDGEMIGPTHLSASVRGDPERSGTVRSAAVTPLVGATENGDEMAASHRPLREAKAEFEKKYIADALQSHKFNVSRTAEALKISRPALQEKMKTYRLR
jgi:transcriptional regulator with PAS, ATPase and Fis domain